MRRIAVIAVIALLAAAAAAAIERWPGHSAPGWINTSAEAGPRGQAIRFTPDRSPGNAPDRRATDWGISPRPTAGRD